MNNSDFQKLKIVYQERDKIWVYCIYHNDNIRPNMSISLLDKYYGRYKCWACGRNGYLTTNQMNNLDIDKSNIITNKPRLFFRWSSFITDCYENFNKFPLLKQELAVELNVSIECLDNWYVGYDGQAFTIPMIDDDGNTCGIQRRFTNGSKRCVYGSKLGYMFAQYPLPNYNEDIAFICEGFSDAINVYSLGFYAIGRPHCHYIDGINSLLTIISYNTTVSIVSDNDNVGKEGAKKLYKEISKERKCKIFKFDGAKDIRDYIKLKGKAIVKSELLDIQNNYYG